MKAQYFVHVLRECVGKKSIIVPVWGLGYGDAEWIAKCLLREVFSWAEIDSWTFLAAVSEPVWMGELAA